MMKRLKMQKVGIYMPQQMALDLDYLCSVSGASRSAVLVELVGPVVSDVALCMRGLEESAAATGGKIEDMAWGEKAMQLFAARLEDAQNLLRTQS